MTSARRQGDIGFRYNTIITFTTSMCLTGWNFISKMIQNRYIDVVEAVMLFVMTMGDAQSSPGKDDAEDERASDSEPPCEQGQSPAQAIRTRGRPRKYLTELDAVEARRRKAREYYHRNYERMDQQKLYQHCRRNANKHED